MMPHLEGLARVFAASDRLFVRALDGADRAVLLRRPGGAGNPMLWIAGHATRVRSQFVGVLGQPHPLAWGDQFNRGGSSADDSKWPDVGEIVTAWTDIATVMQARLAEIAPEELASTTEAPSLDGTLLGAVSLIAFHDAYHVGQLGMLRAHAGLPRLVG
jgi:DinB superfamily